MKEAPPLISAEEQKKLEREEFKKEFARAVAEAFLCFDIVFFSNHPQRYNWLFENKIACKDDQYLQIPQEQVAFLETMEPLLCVPTLAKEVNLHSLDDKFVKNVDRIFPVFAKCEELAMYDVDLKVQLGMVKARLLYMALCMTYKEEDIYKMFREMIAANIIVGYSTEERPVPQNIREQFSESDMEFLAECESTGDDEIELISDMVLTGISNAIDEHVDQEMDGAHPRIREKVRRDRKGKLAGLMNESGRFFTCPLKEFEKNPDIDELVRKILGIK